MRNGRQGQDHPGGIRHHNHQTLPDPQPGGRKSITASAPKLYLPIFADNPELAQVMHQQPVPGSGETENQARLCPGSEAWVRRGYRGAQRGATAPDHTGQRRNREKAAKRKEQRPRPRPATGRGAGDRRGPFAADDYGRSVLHHAMFGSTGVSRTQPHSICHPRTWSNILGAEAAYADGEYGTQHSGQLQPPRL